MAVQIGNNMIFGLPKSIPEDNGPIRVKVNDDGDTDAVVIPDDFTGLMVATPCYGNSVTVDYQQSILRLALACRARAVKCEIAIRSGESLVTRARNGLVAAFLGTSHSHMLFVDADSGFEAQDILRLLSADKDVIGGVFRLKSEEIRPSLRWLGKENEPANIDPASGAFEVQSVGAGLLLIRRPVFDSIAQRNPQLKCLGPMYLTPTEQQLHHAFFDCRIIDGLYVGEDNDFCRLWRDCGGKVWVLPDMDLRHHGTKAYRMSLAQRMRDMTLLPA